MIYELSVRDDSGLLESIHAFDDNNIDKSLVVDDGKKTALIDNVFRDNRYVYLHIIGVG